MTNHSSPAAQHATTARAVPSASAAIRRTRLSPLRRLGLLALVLIHTSAFGAATRPNFIFILIDDMGYGDLSCYGGQPGQTPHIDSIAREGIRLSQFYVGAPICSPSRTAFTTGQHPARWRITSFLAARRANERRGMAQWLDPKAPSLARILQKAGYTTGHFGKWHMGGQRDVSDAPLITEYGFDESLTQFEGLGDRILSLNDAFDGKPAEKYALGSDNLGRGNVQWIDRSKVTSAFVVRTLQFIQKAEKSDQPFYLNLWPDDVHSPFFPPKELRGDGSKRQLYLGVLKAMDAQFAPLFEYLRQSPTLRTNTVLFIASDNGPEPGAGSAGPFRGHKGQLYEGGIREPFIIWAPGLLEPRSAGTVNQESVATAVDLLPSVARIAGVPLPADTRFEGQDLSQAFLGRALPKRGTPLFWARPPDRLGENADPWPDLAMREADWKLLLMRDGSRAQLYQLAQDPGETNNLAGRQPRVLRRMSRQLLDWYQSFPPDQIPITTNAAPAGSAAAPARFLNPIAEGADPWVIRHGTNYWACLSEGNRGLALYRSSTPRALGQKHVIWQAPPSGPYSREIWAPEIHFLDSRWYVYVAASDGHNRNHRMYALQSATADPLSAYSVHGPLYTGDHPDTGADNRWAIDATILEQDGKRYMTWSGWEDTRDMQWLYIAPMKDPLTIGGKRVRLCANDDYLWERVGEQPDGRGLHEAPQILQRNGRTFIVYSCSSSWQPTYKLGLLELRKGGDPLNPKDWTKHPKPVFQSTAGTFGVGHNCFVKSPDGTQDWIIYHAKMDPRDGWRRALFAQPFGWTPEGLPNLGMPVAHGSMLPLPSGEIEHPRGRRWFSALDKPADLLAFNYFGHHQFIGFRDGRLHLGIEPGEPINAYRAGEKAILANHYWRDLSCSVRVRVVNGKRDAGLLFRCTLPGVGYDAQNGYFAGIVPGAGKVVLGSMDCESWREIALVDAPVETGKDYLLSVTATGPQIAVSLDGKEILRRTDLQHSGGSVGLRVVDTHAAFADLRIR